MLKALEAINTPVEFDIIDNFSFEKLEHREKVKNNQCVLVGNLGEGTMKYIENTRFYKWLDLYVNGRVQ